MSPRPTPESRPAAETPPRTSRHRWCLALFALSVLATAGVFEGVSARAASIAMPPTMGPAEAPATPHESDFDTWDFVPCWDHSPCGKGLCWEGICESNGHCIAYKTCV